MKKYEIKISGLVPLLFNRMKKEIEDEKRKLKKNELADWEEKNWKKKAECTKNGELLMPKSWFISALLNACRQSRLVPNFATSKKQTFTSYMGNCMVEDGLLYNSTKPLTLDTLTDYGAFEGGQGSNSNTKVWRIRPMVETPWNATIIFIDPFERMHKDELKELAEYAGAYFGIGDGRKKGYGRFEVNSVKVI